MKNRRPLAVAALIATVALTSGCGSSTQSNSRHGSGSTTAEARKGVKFAKCMRKHGVGDFPDPSASGKVTLDGIVNGSSLNPSTPAFAQALGACKDLEPAGFTGSRRSAQQMTAALRFAQCIREQGVHDFPDPVNGQPLVDTNRIPSANQPGGMSVLNAAMQKCHTIAEQAIGSQS
jgi:hypothetical protein